MLDAESLHARRRTILIFYDPGDGKPIERLTVSRYGLGGLFKPAWDPDKQPDQWKAVADIIAARNPANIAINTSEHQFAFADGMTLSQHTEMMAALPEQYRSRVISGEKLAIGWLETRTPAELRIYPGIVRVAHALIAEAFSRKVITPGMTTTEDVVWWYRQRMANLGLGTWFQPSVGVQRKGANELLDGDTVIQPGDMLWTDFGITYLRLNTDTQHLAYVLKPGETQAPAGLRAGLKAVKWRSGRAALLLQGRCQRQCDACGRAQEGDRQRTRSVDLFASAGLSRSRRRFGDRHVGQPERRRTWRVPGPPQHHLVDRAHRVQAAVPEWGGQKVGFRQEEDAYFDGNKVHFLDGRETSSP